MKVPGAPSKNFIKALILQALQMLRDNPLDGFSRRLFKRPAGEGAWQTTPEGQFPGPPPAFPAFPGRETSFPVRSWRHIGWMCPSFLPILPDRGSAAFLAPGDPPLRLDSAPIAGGFYKLIHQIPAFTVNEQGHDHPLEGIFAKHFAVGIVADVVLLFGAL